MPAKDNYLIVNIWTSEENEAVPGANVGHIALQTADTYMSLWPGKRTVRTENMNKFERFFQNYFGERPASFKTDYYEDAALEALSERVESRNITHFSNCQPDEVVYQYNSETRTFKKVSAQPMSLDPNERLVALKPLYANIRIVLYGLRLDLIENKFKEVSDPDNNERIKTWRMIGSTLLKSDTESCSGLAYLLLTSGGLYDTRQVKNFSSRNYSGSLSPDDLIKPIIAYKEKELTDHSETKNWDQDICPEHSSIVELKKAFENSNENSSCTLV